MLSPTPTAQAGDRNARYAELGEVRLCYEGFGDGADETLVLVMGLGMQMVAWHEELCGLLAARGFRVVRFDNRDVGLSSKLAGRVNLAAGMIGITGSAPYTLDEMAADVVGLLDHLDVERAHLVGASMGGMIAQQAAALYPRRVASLCSIMAGGGSRRISRMPRPDVLGTLFRSPPPSRQAYVEDLVEVFARIGSPAYPTDEAELRERIGHSYDRCFYPAGVARQLMAVMASGNRARELRSIRAPSLIVHGTEDRLVPPRAGGDVAAAIPRSRMKLFAGMGHDLPAQLWPRLAELIAANARDGGGH